MTDSNGILVIDKPTGITSRDAVDCAQRWFPRGTRIGHTGTLDPLATGILVICVGSATRLTEYVQQMPKVYRAGITFGATSDTDDADGVITPIAHAAPPSREEVMGALVRFVGTIDQVPPAFSAAKVTGRRAYALARKGKEVVLTPRKVTIHHIELTEWDYPRAEFVVRCGKGTYIRSLARDLGQFLGCGAYISALRRTSVGSFTERDAVSLDIDAETAWTHMLAPWRAIQDWTPPALTSADVLRLRQGQRIEILSGVSGETGPFAVVDADGFLVSIVEPIDGMLQPVKVLRTPSSQSP